MTVPACEEDVHGRTSRWARLARVWGFPILVVALYGALSVADPGRAVMALRATGEVLLQAAVPLGVAFVVMVVLNLFATPAHVSRLAGRGAGLRAIVLSTVAGVLSTGPIYAWYPLLRSLRQKGASDFHLANFLSNRAVKPFLLPVMVFYFGWVFTLLLTVLTVVGALVVATMVSIVSGDKRAAMRETP